MAVPLVPGPGLGDANAAQKSMSTLLKNQCDFCAVLIETKQPRARGRRRVWDGAGHVGVGRGPGVAGDPSLPGVEWAVAKGRSQVGGDDLVAGAAKSAARGVVEHVFHWVKDMFGLRRTRHGGLAKAPDQAAVAAAGCMIARRGRRLCGPPLALSAEGMAPRRERLEGRRRRAEGRAPAAAWPTAGRPAMAWEAAAWPPETGVARLGALEPSSRQKSPMLVPKGRDRRLYHRFPSTILGVSLTSASSRQRSAFPYSPGYFCSNSQAVAVQHWLRAKVVALIVINNANAA